MKRIIRRHQLVQQPLKVMLLNIRKRVSFFVDNFLFFHRLDDVEYCLFEVSLLQGCRFCEIGWLHRSYAVVRDTSLSYLFGFLFLNRVAAKSRITVIIQFRNVQCWLELHGLHANFLPKRPEILQGLGMLSVVHFYGFNETVADWPLIKLAGSIKRN